jgi:hypothetical protein
MVKKSSARTMLLLTVAGAIWVLVVGGYVVTRVNGEKRLQVDDRFERRVKSSSISRDLKTKKGKDTPDGKDKKGKGKKGKGKKGKDKKGGSKGGGGGDV